MANYSTTENLNEIRLLQASADSNDISEIRIVVNGKHIKYVTIDPGIFDVLDIIFEPILIELLRPILPAGDWNHAYISKVITSKESADCETQTKVEVSKQTLPGINETWHSVKIGYLDFQIGARLRSNVYEARHPNFPRPVVIKFARFAWEVGWLESETAAYRWIDGQGIGPEFLGHLTEHGRTIGFIMSRAEGARHATPEDFELCRAALQSLYARRIKHGDINKHNLLVHGGCVTLIDFDMAVQNATAEELADELQSLEGELRDTSGRGGIANVETTLTK